MRIGMQLKIARIESDWTMDKSSKLSGVAKSSISEIESGKKSPTARTIEKLCDVYGYELRIIKKERDK